MIDYNRGEGIDKNWVLSESKFDNKYLAKYEVLMAQGNGYMGIRSCLEENYVGETRNFFIAGIFNKCDETEVTELANLPDFTNINIDIDGKRFTMNDGKTKEYERKITYRTGEVVRQLIWESPTGKEIKLTFRRFVSLSDRHLAGIRIEIIPLSDSIDISIESSIDGQVTNSGSQHLFDGEKRVIGNTLRYETKTTESNVRVLTHATNKLWIDDRIVEFTPNKSMSRRRVTVKYPLNLQKENVLVFEKIVNVYTDRDVENIDKEFEEVLKIARENVDSNSAKGYCKCLEESSNNWENYYNDVDVKIESDNEFDQLAMRFAQYHLRIMTPIHDNRMGIAAKGLTGEGYKGHSFWDTEIFILPYYLFTSPEIAKDLLVYRYYGLQGAREKAREYGFKGAMFPWESAWITDGEVTPKWGDVDIITGESIKIWTGIKEHHITSDISYAVWQYYQVTKDDQFMKDYGYEIIFDTAVFWSTRLDHNIEEDRYEILDVIGPDEYKEHIDNNAFTNYMVKFNMDLAIEYHSKLNQDDRILLRKLDDKTNIIKYLKTISERSNKLKLQKPRKTDKIIPQDDTYLQKKIINLDKYILSDTVNTIFNDYNPKQINDIQVSKQADILMLLFLHEHLFNTEIRKLNYNYYESKTIHDSSLSPAFHTIIANDCNYFESSYKYFEKACRVDLGQNMNSSNAGIHSASLGGIWQATVFGFAGVRYGKDGLRMNPKLPRNWNSISFKLVLGKGRIEVEIEKNRIHINVIGKPSLENISIFGTSYQLMDEIILEY